VGRVRELLEFIKLNIPLRTCKLNLTETNIKKGKFKVCLEYHLGNCKGPCEGLQTLAEYEDSLQQLKNILQGNLAPVIKHFKEERKQYAEQLEFEKAAAINAKIEHLQDYKYKSAVVNTKVGTIDVFNIRQEDAIAYVNYLAVTNGTIIQTQTITLTIKLDETREEVLAFAIAQLREAFNSTAGEVIVPFALTYPDETIRFTIPKSGDKKKLLELSEKNVDFFREELRKKKALGLESQTDTDLHKVLEQLQADLKLFSFPDHIECFDNSNLQGSNPVSAMVCFRNGRPFKNDYRKFNVKTVTGINDFATMKEVVFRRYIRLLEENEPLPNLVIIDGGKGQLSAAMESITSLGLTGKITVVGLAKNEEEIFFPNDKDSIKLPWGSESLNLVRRIRDEVHRFGISFHRNQRSKSSLTNELEQIEGIGKNTITALLKKFRSVKNISTKTADELAEVTGAAKAKLITAYFSQKNNGLQT
jgi:excinuclease ABC subunit C